MKWGPEVLTSNPLLSPTHSVFYDGAWQIATGESMITVNDPSTGEVLGELPCGSAKDVADAARFADAAFSDWASTPGVERAGYLRAFAAGLEQRAEILMDVMMRNGRKPRHEAEIDLGDAIATFTYYADLAGGLDERQNQIVHHAGAEQFGQVRFEPVVPIGLIVPWNFPLVTSAWKIAPALSAGCTLALKTTEMTPFIELTYADIALEIDLPAGVLNIVTGAAEAGAAINQAPEFRKISFTGSNMIGGLVMKSVAERCLPIALELGGKSAIIVTADADIALAVDCIAGGVFYNAGQMCSATSRLIVEESIEAVLMDALVERVNELKVGSPQEPDIDMGPITNKTQYDRILATLEKAKTDKLECVAGGSKLDRGMGYFVAPTIFRTVDPTNSAWTDEIFGLVLVTTTFKTDDEAIKLANMSEYALVGSVVCGDPQRAKALADRIVAGQIWINTLQIVYPDSAWGGFKSSGIGRELGPWGLSGYQGVKHITLPVSARSIA